MKTFLNNAVRDGVSERIFPFDLTSSCCNLILKVNQLLQMMRTGGKKNGQEDPSFYWIFKIFLTSSFVLV